MNKQKKTLALIITLLVLSVPLFSIVNGRPLTETLKDLSIELKMVYDQRDEMQGRFDEENERQHQKMIDIITKTNELSILLYTQELEMTFDLAYALKKVTTEFKDFSKDRKPYDHIVNNLNIEIDRYARLLEALRRLPPMMQEIEFEIIPDSLLYHNDSIDLQFLSTATALEREVIMIATKDSLSAPFVLDEEGEIYRDSCIKYTSELLKMYADNRATIVADSVHYQEAFMRLKESYDYAESRYRELEKYFFVDGQTPFLSIIADPKTYWAKTLIDLRSQYDFEEIFNDSTSDVLPIPDSLLIDYPADTMSLARGDSASALSPADEDEDSEIDRYFGNLTSKGANAYLLFVCIMLLFFLFTAWLATFLIIMLLSLIFRRRNLFPKNKRTITSILVGSIVYFLLVGFFLAMGTIEYMELVVKHFNTFLWLLIAITGSLLLRVKPEQIKNGIRLYIPTFVIALVIIVCRNAYVPDKLMVLLLPPILSLIVLRQLFFCIKESGKATPVDSVLGWVSLIIYVIAFTASFMGYTFIALLILVWWYFQLAVLLTILCITDMMSHYKERRLKKRVDSMRERITYVSGADRESLLFGATWFYEFLRQVTIPALLLLSIPFCVHMSIDIFDFDDLYEKIFNIPFVQLVDKNGVATLRISGRSIIGLMILFFALRYLNKAVHAIYQYLCYTTFMRKHNRTTIRDNEINLSLGNSIISVLVWMSYAVVFVAVCRIPMGSLSLVAGGLSAGIGLALKDILNNFIYGIQLMGGRLRVGDWIECDGIRGRVIAINYQFVQVETLEGTEMSFLNASLFGKNFNNLTRNNSYEFTKIIVGVAYGTDIKKVREVLVEAMQQMRTKDRYGREIVEPKYGIKVVVNEMSESSVDIAVKQHVLVAERIGYIDHSKEVIYEALNNANITIPFPQCDVHLINDDSRNEDNKDIVKEDVIKETEEE
ncbi:MAG: mechanosensitive ion channel family protein [Bacteroidales bacterium]|nr:mechanosensitive ion channel family protein [Bacteroidales bacterium]